MGPYFKETVNALNAGWWELRLARMFGKTVYGHDGLYWAKFKVWRGKNYLVDCYKEPIDEQPTTEDGE